MVKSCTIVGLELQLHEVIREREKHLEKGEKGNCSFQKR